MAVREDTPVACTWPEHDPEQWKDNQYENVDQRKRVLSKSTSLPVDISVLPDENHHRSVSFTSAEIIEFEPTFHTATVSSCGVTIGLSHKVRRRACYHIDSWEDQRVENRIGRQEYMERGYMDPQERINILQNCGLTIGVIDTISADDDWISEDVDCMYQQELAEIPLLEDDEENYSSDDEEVAEPDESDDSFHFDSARAKSLTEPSDRFIDSSCRDCGVRYVNSCYSLYNRTYESDLLVAL
uniref:Uncharacterized protein AlNc14C293G10266 n=1 Tax=Albugo laibachii Nc14 TaxID=890382 RepID=F0WVC2_9STRA|nr:conserved hypothetical protein [Albugo laibachii Nc14]|eukprot:CCA25361.1 conserved hypothetical protein [Albugo laibachii Nc14]